MFGYGGGYVGISSGTSCGRSVHDFLLEGSIRIKGVNPDGIPYERSVKVKDCQIYDSKLKEGKRLKTTHHIVYGKFETVMRKRGRQIIHFRKGSSTGKHGLSKTWEKIFGSDGVCYSWYKNGRLIRQKFIYDNKKVAYSVGIIARNLPVKDSSGNLLYEVSGALDGRVSYGGFHSVFAKKMEDWFLIRVPFQVKKDGKVCYSGQYENRQRVGAWVEGGKEYFYERGVQVPKELYETPPEKLDPKKILKIENVQLRMALLAKIGVERIVKVAKVVHKDGDMALYEVKGMDVKILRVKCPSTQQFYYLRVPHNSSECEQARQWTFGVGESFQKHLKFEVET